MVPWPWLKASFTQSPIAAWPTGEFGGMGLEGFVKKGYEKQLNAVEDPVERQALFDKLLNQQIARGKAINMAAYLEIDAVIDPADTREWIMRNLESTMAKPKPVPKHNFIDAW